MARLLVATVPLTGHVQPMRVLVGELVRRGHDVHWYTGARFAETVARTGARYVPMRRALDWDDADVEATVSALRGRRGLSRVKTQLRELFIGPMVDQLRDLEEVDRALHPDALLADSAHLGAALLAETTGIPWIGLGISALMVPSIDTAPFGSAFPPAPGPAGERRNKIMNHVVFRVMFAGINRAFRRARVAAGLPAGAGMYFDVLARDLFLQPTVPSFEYPRRDLPPQVELIGPLIPSSPPTAELPHWWADVLDARARGIPVILVTQGTLATDPTELIGPAVRGLADEDVLVIVTGRVDDALAKALPLNTRVAPFVPYTELLPHVAAVVTNGGYGGVQQALAHGIPLVCAGGSEEKPEIAARIAWSGTGIDLRTGTPTPWDVRAAVRTVLDEPRFRLRATEIAAEMAGYDAPARGADRIEQLLAAHVHRRQAVGA
jgi:MGT family glycosyltransferase